MQWPLRLRLLQEDESNGGGASVLDRARRTDRTAGALLVLCAVRDVRTIGVRRAVHVGVAQPAESVRVLSVCVVRCPDYRIITGYG